MKTCPECNNEMNLGKRFYFCPECGFSMPIENISKEINNRLYSSRYIFISYGHDSFASIAHKLCKDLETRGHRVWTDLELKTGDDWAAKIEEAMDKAIAQKPNGCFLLLMSPHSVRRPDGYCLNELSKAVRNGLFTIPVKLQSIEPPLSIARIQYLDMSECFVPGFSESIYQRQLDLLVNAIENDSINFDGMQARLQNLLKPIEFKNEIRKYMKSFTGREWILQRIKEWLYNPQGSKVFWLTGGPGVGKTAISVWLSCKQLPEIHAWHLCQHSDSITSNPKNCILSLAYYLSTHLPDYFEKLNNINIEEFVNLNSMNVNTLFTRLLIEPLNEIPPLDKPVIILIDAIDEASSENGENTLAKFIGSKFSLFPPWIRLLVTSRPIHEVKKWFRQLHPEELDTSDIRNLEDIKKYINNRISHLDYSPKQKESIAQSILSKSEGVFLYAEFVCDSIDLGEMDALNPESFPHGLYNTYEDYFMRRFPSIEKYNTEISPFLKLVIAAKEPLNINEIDSFFHYKYTDWDEDSLYSVIKQLGSLFKSEDNVIVPFHKSIVDWLTRDKDSNYFINRKKGHRSFIEWASSFKKNYSRMPVYFLKYLGEHYIYMNEYDATKKLLTDTTYLQEQIKRLGYDQAISIYFSNIKNLNTCYPQYVAEIYKSSFFLELLNNSRRYFLDNGYFLDLEQMNFGDIASEILISEITDNSNYVGILYYLYALEKFLSVVELTEKILRNEQMVNEMSAHTKSQMYEVYGLSERKLGRFAISRDAFEKTSYWGIKAENSYQISLGYANLAKIDYHQLNFKSGYENNKLAFDYLLKGLDEESALNGGKITSVRLFLAEYKRLAAENYIWGYEYEKTKECFKYIEQTYSQIKLRDRYYVRYLYTSALYNICTGNQSEANLLLVKAWGLCRNNYDKAIVIYYQSLISLVKDFPNYDEKEIEKLHISENLFQKINSNIELTEVRILYAMLSNNEETCIVYDASNYEWFAYIFNYFNQLISKNNGNKSIRKWRMDTDSDKKYLFISRAEQ